MLKLKSSFLILLSLFSISAAADVYLGEGIRQNTTLSTFDSYKMVHRADNAKRVLDPSVGRTLDLTMIADFGLFFTKAKMVEALEQSIKANMTTDEIDRFSSEIKKFKKTMLILPIASGTELQFLNIPGQGLEIQMKASTGYRVVFSSTDPTFSMKIFSIWLGKAHPDANNRESLEALIEALWEKSEK